MDIVSNAVLVPIKINDHQLRFLLDTGSEQSAIDATAANRLALPGAGQHELLRDYREEQSSLVDASRISVGTAVFEHHKLNVIGLGQLSQALGITVEGVLGNDLLEHFPFRLNYSKHTMETGLRNRNSWGAPVNLRRTRNEYYVPLTILSQPAVLLLDSGANSTNLSWSTWQDMSQTWKPESIVDGVVRAGAAAPSAFMVCLPSLSVANLKIVEQPVRVQRKVESGAFASPKFGGILGSDILRNFEVTFDLNHNRIYLKRDPAYKADPFRFVTVGIQFAASKGGYMVMSVWRNSPADEAGIRPGDIIVSINGKPVATLTPEQLAAPLHGVQGTPVDLVIERNGQSQGISMRTRQLLCGRHRTHN